MIEVCFLIGDDGAVLWADRSTSASELPDSRARWEAIWRLRDRLTVVAHTHPSGALEFSAVDRTTMAALDAALGRPLAYVVVTAEGMRSTHPAGETEPWWAALMRAASGMEGHWRS
ncbi:proteasome lid subunit RPN8/RPN11 [Lipingzhangella halophila]|uniref:Proteasome lid subunit RPN8/RPN11 n=1 Tax=Lipingzhangella halophila TaxID=1783352 RepID=A0A7W7W3F1_9ACTN|nr:Mov34/MPN/PAD-1 family protein [Lipingzhangella halophila]MBB4931739.1 proteasome lid subunit RPN8/RPN11 [Lipingzhangella halophila]